MGLLTYIPRPAGGSPPPPTQILLDNFTGPDQLLELHPMDVGPGWNKVTGDFQILSNVCAGGPTGTDPIYLSDAGQPTGTATLDVVLDLSDNQVNIYAASASNTAGAVIAICYPSTNHVQLYQAGVLDNQPFTFSAGAQTWKLVVTLTTASFYINGVLISTAAITPVNHYWGIEVYHPGLIAQSSFTQFSVTDP